MLRCITTTRSTPGQKVALENDGPEFEGAIANCAPIVNRMHMRLAAMGLVTLGKQTPRQMFDGKVLAQIVRAATEALETAKLGRGVLIRIGPGATYTQLGTMIEEVMELTEHSPVPHTEWGAVREMLGDELLVRLVGVSADSMRRYISGERGTPDDVAARLHFLALVNADLAGSYNDLGLRRWWQRPRRVLEARTWLIGEPSADIDVS